MEACLVEDARQEAKEHDQTQLKVEEGVRLTLEARQIVDEDNLGLKDEEEMLKYEAEDQARLKAEEEDQITEEARMKAQDHKRARL